MQDFPYPNPLLRQTLEGIEVVLGRKGLEAALRRAGLAHLLETPPANDLRPHTAATAQQVAQLHGALVEMTGRAAGPTLQRIGREAFAWGQANPSSDSLGARLAVAMLPAGLRERAVLRALAAGLNDLIPSGQVRSGRVNGRLFLEDRRCPHCHGQQVEGPVCHLYAGYVAAALCEVAGREAATFTVVETMCCAAGAGCCRFEVVDSRHAAN